MLDSSKRSIFSFVIAAGSVKAYDDSDNNNNIFDDFGDDNEVDFVDDASYSNDDNVDSMDSSSVVVVGIFVTLSLASHHRRLVD